MINCEIELILAWSKKFVFADITVRAAGNDNVPAAIVAPTRLEFQIWDTKLYVPVVTLSKENDKKLLQQLKPVFKTTVKWNKHRSQMTIQPQNDSLNYLIDPTFTKVDRLFALSFERNAEGDHRDSFSHYYVPNTEIKDFNVLIDGKSFFESPIKNEGKAYKGIIEMSRNNDYTAGNLLDFAYFKENYRLIAIDLSSQTKLKDPPQISFIAKFKNQAHGSTMFLIIKKSEETTFEFLKNSVNIL